MKASGLFVLALGSTQFPASEMNIHLGFPKPQVVGPIQSLRGWLLVDLRMVERISEPRNNLAQVVVCVHTSSITISEFGSLTY